MIVVGIQEFIMKRDFTRRSNDFGLIEPLEQNGLADFWNIPDLLCHRGTAMDFVESHLQVVMEIWASWC